MEITRIVHTCQRGGMSTPPETRFQESAGYWVRAHHEGRRNLMHETQNLGAGGEQ